MMTDNNMRRLPGLVAHQVYAAALPAETPNVFLYVPFGATAAIVGDDENVFLSPQPQQSRAVKAMAGVKQWVVLDEGRHVPMVIGMQPVERFKRRLQPFGFFSPERG
jgi:hypothetical protein